MAKEEQSNQLNLTVVALVALVAIVGLVALVMNAASITKLSTGSQIVSADENLAGQPIMYPDLSVDTSWGGKTCKTDRICSVDTQCIGWYGSVKYTCQNNDERGVIRKRCCK